MRVVYKTGVCSKCGKEKIITQKSKQLCFFCQQYSYKRPIVKKPQKPIPKFSVNGRKRKLEDVSFYKKAWELKQDECGGNYCENCGKYLVKYSSVFISHILSRGAFPELAHDFDNYFILCLNCHSQVEFGKDKESMNIYYDSLKRIESLKQKYYENK